jgi:hypothetical protein
MATLPLRWTSTGGRPAARRRGEALALQVQADDLVLVHAQAVERVVLGGAAARVGVDLAVDQLHHGALAVAGDPGALAAGGGHHLAAHHQQAVLVARDAALDDHLAALAVGQAKAASMSACWRRSRATPRPWLPSLGLTTTGRPMSWAASQASAALATTWPSGTGTPQA